MKPSERNNKKMVLLIFHYDELIYDIISIASIHADALEEATDHIKHIIQDINEGENRYRTMRYINLAYQICVNMLHQYTHADVSNFSTLDNTAGTPDKNTMRLLVPEHFDKGQVALLKNLIHDYIVWYTYIEWLRLILPDAVSVIANKPAELEIRIKKAMDSSGKVGRIKMFP